MLDCEVVKDLLPLYTEQMVSPHTEALVSAHLQSCPACAALHRSMTEPEPAVQFSTDSAQQFAAYEKKQKRKTGLKVGTVLTFLFGAVTAAVVWFLRKALVTVLALSFCIPLLMLDSALARVKVDTDPAHYSDYMFDTAKPEYRHKISETDESIFPAKLTDNMDIREYKMVYYNPWDPQYLSYLTVHYSPEDYEAETKRLAEYGCDFYQGSYGVTGFPGGEPLAVHADAYYGYVYAINTPNAESNTITYCEIIFCNYFMDLKYEKYMPAEYFPLNFNAKSSNRAKQEQYGKAHPEMDSLVQNNIELEKWTRENCPEYLE
ncbi:MAG: zf-HC2 domain-containing protein [Oscillospiraceae bacterium]|nr:zf-HC2 domain-containing protein [Oscillospiraceae bacterium]